MKKIIAPFILLFLSVAVFSQTTTPTTPAPNTKTPSSGKKFRFGFKIAPNVAWMKSDNETKLATQGGHLGFSYGFNLDYKLNKNFSLITGFDITNINGKVTNNNTIDYFRANAPSNDTTSINHHIISTSTELNMKAKYIEIPLIFSGKTNEIGYFTYFIQGGFAPGILIGQNAYIKTLSPKSTALNGNTSLKLNSSSSDEYVTKNDDVKLLRLGFIIGAGAEYNIGGGTSLVGSLRFNNGLFHVLKTTDKVINNYISLNIGVLF